MSSGVPIGSDLIHIGDLVLPFFNQLMFRRHNHICCAEQRIRTRGIYPNDIACLSCKKHFCTSRASDPVFLLGIDTLNKIQIIQIIYQALRIFCDFQHPLAFNLVNNLAAAAFANTVDNFFICQNAFAGSAPVDRHFLFVCQSLFKQLQKDPLRPFIIRRIGGVDLTAPVERKAQRLQLLFKMSNVLLGYDLRMDMIFDRIIFCGQTESIPTHGI